jgi:hypothetical protein
MSELRSARPRRRFLSGRGHLNRRDARKVETYRLALAALRRATALSNPEVEFVDVPFGNYALPALFVPARGGDGRSPW